MTSFICPFCGFVSHHPRDTAERYCARCHVFIDDVQEAAELLAREVEAEQIAVAALFVDDAPPGTLH